MKISKEDLRKIVQEEMKKLGMGVVQEDKGKLKSTEDAAKDAVEVDPGEEGRHNEKEMDAMKALKIKESKLLQQLGEVRYQVAKLNKKSAK